MLRQSIEYHVEKIIVENLANFGLLFWQGDSLAYAILIIELYLTWSNGHPEPWIEVGSKAWPSM